MFRCHVFGWISGITNLQQKQEKKFTKVSTPSTLSYKVGIEEEFHLLRTRMDSGRILGHRWDSWRNFYSSIVCEDGAATTWLAQLINDISLPFQMNSVTGYHLCQRGHLVDCLLILSLCPGGTTGWVFKQERSHTRATERTMHPATAISVKETLKPFCHSKRYAH